MKESSGHFRRPRGAGGGRPLGAARAAWQRCQAHFLHNVAEAAPKGLRAGLRSKLAEMFNCPDRASAKRRRDEIATDYRERAPRAVEQLLEGFDDTM